MDIKAGDILLFKRGGLIPKLIQWGTNSKYSHVAVCINPAQNLIVEAQGRVRAADLRAMKDFDVYRIKPNYAYDLDETISFLVSKLNEGYDYFGVAYLGILKLLNRIGLPTKNAANAWQREHDYFCSEYAWSGYAAGGLDITPQIGQADIVSPGDIGKSKIVEYKGSY